MKSVLVIGGNRFFGKRLVQYLVNAKFKVITLNRGSEDDGFGDSIERIQCDRRDPEALSEAVKEREFDFVYDHACFDAEEARDATKIFKNRVGKYILTSSQAVYFHGEYLKEKNFDPQRYIFTHTARRDTNYGEAKRQAEVELLKANSFPVTMIRFPVVMGPDDHTERLKWHVDRVRNAESICFPNTRAKMSFIHADDAARAMLFCAVKDVLGPINVSASEPIVLKQLIKKIERHVGRSAILVNSDVKEYQSPYGIEKDWYMDCSKYRSLGGEARAITDWLDSLIQEL